MTHLADRLAELQRHLHHLEDLRPRIAGACALRQDLSLHNDVLFSLLIVSQSVIDVSAELGRAEIMTTRRIRTAPVVVLRIVHLGSGEVGRASGEGAARH
jgi:hypothetical protein